MTYRLVYIEQISVHKLVKILQCISHYIDKKPSVPQHLSGLHMWYFVTYRHEIGSFFEIQNPVLFVGLIDS